MEIPTLTFEEIEKYLQKAKTRGSQVIEIIAKYNKYLTIILGDEIGRNIIQSDIKRIDDLFKKVYNEDITPQEMAEFRYLRDNRIPSIIEKITTYMKLLKKVKEIAKA